MCYLVQVSDAVLEGLLKCLVGDLLDEGREIRFRYVEETIRLQIRRAKRQNVHGGQLSLKVEIKLVNGGPYNSYVL